MAQCGVLSTWYRWKIQINQYIAEALNKSRIPPSSIILPTMYMWVKRICLPFFCLDLRKCSQRSRSSAVMKDIQCIERYVQMSPSALILWKESKKKLTVNSLTACKNPRRGLNCLIVVVDVECVLLLSRRRFHQDTLCCSFDCYGKRCILLHSIMFSYNLEYKDAGFPWDRLLQWQCRREQYLTDKLGTRISMISACACPT